MSFEPELLETQSKAQDSDSCLVSNEN